MTHPENLQGWTPLPGVDMSLAEIVELAFDYRGDVTVVMADGSQVAGYLFNRDRDVPDPFVQLFDTAGNGRPISIPYAQIRQISFTGRDTAAGNSYEAWKQRRAESKER